MRPAAASLAGFMAAAAACAAPAADEQAKDVPSAVAEQGERLYQQCFACHAIEPGRNTPAGPTLHAVMGKAIASEPGFNYSPALHRLAGQHGHWTPELLDRFIANPEAVAPGTEMGFPGLEDPADRQALIDWLAR